MENRIENEVNLEVTDETFEFGVMDFTAEEMLNLNVEVKSEYNLDTKSLSI